MCVQAGGEEEDNTPLSRETKAGLNPGPQDHYLSHPGTPNIMYLMIFVDNLGLIIRIFVDFF